ncbi:MAG: hypothetical protein A3H93_20330 [Rhodocyclales bacterium RIFCSPLOWO2_02_FULL_63_24]|nr:MAG: hypothetical protein A3H93_20330 [Rhodocyclales bacterium RIFCSPLOWO2_02_FULL_63_24]
MMPPRRIPLRSSYLGQWLLLGIVLFACGVAIAYSLYRDRQRIAVGEQERLAAHAQIVERNLAPQIFSTRRALDGILADLPSWKQEKGGLKRANQRLKVISDTLPGIRTLLVTNADGIVIASDREELIGLDVSRRDYFQTPRQRPDGNILYVGPPIKAVLGVLVMTLGRAITGPSGEFAGVVNASVDPDYFRILLDSMRYTTDTWTYLAHGDGKLFLMMPEREALAGKNLGVAGSFFSRHRDSGQAASMFSGIAYVTGEERMMALRTVLPEAMAMDKPLVIAVSRDLSAVFATWRGDAYAQFGLFGALILAATLGLFFYQRRQHAYDRLVANHEAEQKAMLANEVLLRNIIQALDEGVLLLDGQGVVVFANAAAGTLLGCTQDQLAGKHCPQLLQPAQGSDTAECPLCTAATSRMPFYSRAMTFRRSDGAGVPVSIRATPTNGAGGGLVVAFYDMSAEKSAQEAVAVSERRLHVLIDAIPDSALLLDRDGRIETINSIGARRLGSTPEQITGRDAFDMLPKAVAGRRHAVFAGVCASGQPAAMVDQRGQNIFKIDLFPVTDASGEVRQVAVYAQDVTESRRAEAVQAMFHEIGTLLLRREISLDTLVWHFCRRLATTLDLAFVWIGRKQADGGIEVAAGAEASAGYLARLKELGVRWDEVGSDPVCSVLRQGKLQVAETGAAGNRPWQALAAEHGAGHLVCLPLTLDGGTYAALTLGIRDTLAPDTACLERFDDIASRLCLAMKAAMQQERLSLMETALETTGNAVFITDADGNILWANGSFGRLTGYLPAEVVGRNPKLLSSGIQTPAFYAALWETILVGNIWQGEVVEARRDGSRFTVHQTITPLRDPEGRISHFVSILEDISVQKAAQERVVHLANYDALTDLPNRRLFFDRLGQVLALAHRAGNACALLFLDLDRFKEVNDRRGHEAGDQLLVEVADRLRSLVRESDTVARLAGDEFTVILGAVGGREDCAQVAAKIVASLGQGYEIAGGAVSIGVSIGIALFPADAADSESLVSAADQAMYAAKAAGRSTFRFFGGLTDGDHGAEGRH